MLHIDTGRASPSGNEYLFGDEVIENGFRLYFSNKINELRRIGKLSWQEGMSSDWMWDIFTGNPKETGLSASPCDPNLSMGQVREVEIITMFVRIGLYFGIDIPEIQEDSKGELIQQISDGAVLLHLKKMQAEVAKENPDLQLNPTDISPGALAWMPEDLRQSVADVLAGRALIS